MSNLMLSQIIDATWETLYMVGLSTFIATLFGLPLGVLLRTTQQNGLLENLMLNRALSSIVNVLRSIPFIILLVAIIPLTRLIVGTSIGTTATIVPLSIGAIPFIARIVENALSEVSYGLTEAGLSMGATPWQIIRKILLPEAASGIIKGLTLTVITLIGYSAMAGAVGGGGLGDLAIRYGYQRFDITIMIVTVVILIALVQVIQWVGELTAQRFNQHFS